MRKRKPRNAGPGIINRKKSLITLGVKTSAMYAASRTRCRTG
jgi:hypothetical protein